MDDRFTFSLSGRRALVTGSARGLGLEMARGLGRAGASIVINGRDPVVLGEVAARLRNESLDVTSAAFDVTDVLASGKAIEHLGQIDILVNNVGHRDRRGLTELSSEDLTRMLTAHLTSAYALSQKVASALIDRGLPGRIINISSIMGQLGRFGDVAYAVAKAGLDGLTRALAVDLGRQNITVNSVAPGPFATEANAQLAADPQWEQWLQSRTVLGRWGRAEEIAGIVVFLASDTSSFITGQTIAVDGGMTIKF